MCSVDCSPCQHATRKPVKTVKHRPDITVQPRVAVLTKSAVSRCLNGLIRDIVPRGGEVECVQAMHYLPNTTVSVSPALGRQPPLLCSLTSRHWRPYFLSLSDQKIERLQVYIPCVRLSAGNSRTTKRILIITAYLPEFNRNLPTL
jgi:hypothetical protein